MPGRRERIEAIWVLNTHQYVELRLEGGLAPLGGDRQSPGTVRRLTFREKTGLDKREKLSAPK